MRDMASLESSGSKPLNIISDDSKSGDLQDLEYRLRNESLDKREKSILKYMSFLMICYGIATLMFLVCILWYYFWGIRWDRKSWQDIEQLDSGLLAKDYFVWSVLLFLMCFCLFQFVKYCRWKRDLLHKEYLLNLLECSYNLFMNEKKKKTGINSEREFKPSEEIERIIDCKSNLDLYVYTQIKRADKSVKKEFFKKILEDY